MGDPYKMSDDKKVGRPLIEVDEALLEKLSGLHLSDKAIADILKCSVDTLHRRFADKMEAWRSETKSKIAEVLFDEALNKREPWALKALAQKHLDYSDRIKSENENTNNNTNTNLSDAELIAKRKELQAKLDEKA